jgi:hypothetical protein
MGDAKDGPAFFLRGNDRVHPIGGLRGHQPGGRESSSNNGRDNQEETHHFLPQTDRAAVPTEGTAKE